MYAVCKLFSASSTTRTIFRLAHENFIIRTSKSTYEYYLQLKFNFKNMEEKYN